MTTDLMTPRVIVDHIYPAGHFSKNTILYLDVKANTNMYYPMSEKDGVTEHCVERCIDDGSNIFRRLPWWEHRSIDQMPEYVKYFTTTPSELQVMKVSKWEIRESGSVYAFNEKGSELLLDYEDQPATKQEYNDYINSKK